MSSALTSRPFARRIFPPDRPLVNRPTSATGRTGRPTTTRQHRNGLGSARSTICSSIKLAILDLEKQWNLWRTNPHVPPGGMFININTMQAGTSLTSVPDSAEATGSLLFNPDLRGDEVIAEICAVLDRVTDSDYWLREHRPVLDLPLDSTSDAPWIKEPVDLPHDHPVVNAIQSAMEATTGHASAARRYRRLCAMRISGFR